MRWGWLFAICFLTSLTGGAYQPLFDSYLGMFDPLMIFIAWLALIDRMSRIIVVVVALTLLRVWFGIGTFSETAIPLVGVVASVRMLRQILDPYHPWKRFQILVPSFIVGIVSHWFLLLGDLSGSVSTVVAGLSVSLIFAGLMLPILDLSAPLLRSARYPL